MHSIALAATLAVGMTFTQACGPSSSSHASRSPGAPEATVSSIPRQPPLVSATSASARPCSWLTPQQVSRVIGRPVAAGVPNALSRSCSFAFTSASGISTDVVVAAWDVAAESLHRLSMAGHEKHAVEGVGEDAVFFRAYSVDDGNSTLVVQSSYGGFLVGSEFITEIEATQLARLVLSSLRAAS
jgi:hypothetical protein